MSVVPRTVMEKITFFATRVGPWAANAAAIGTTPQMVADLQDQTDAAREAFDAQQSAKNAALAATIALKAAIDRMARTGAAIISQVRGKADLAGDGVYSLAQIPVPVQRSPLGAPGKPEAFSSTLDARGTLSLTWRCENPKGSAGTMYQVWRRIGAEGEFTYIGGSGSKRFVDDTVPAGTTSVMYKVQAIRSTAVGPVALHEVNFGSTNAGMNGAIRRPFMTKASLRRSIAA